MVLFALGIIFLNYKYARLVSDKLSALWSCVFLATSPLIIFFTKTVNIDLPNLFFMLFSLYAYEKSKKSGEWYWLLGIGLGLSVLTRSFFVIFPAAVIIFDILNARHDRSSVKGIIIAFITLLLVSVPWHIIAFIYSSSAFIRDYIDLPVINHWMSKIPGDSQTNIFFYLNILILFPPVFIALIQPVHKKFRHLSQTEKTLIFWAGFVLLILSVAPTRHEWYLFPALPPLSILAGIYTASQFNLYPGTFRNFFLRLATGTIILSPSVLLFTAALPQSAVIGAVQAVEKVSAVNDGIIELNYPLIPETSFFPKRKVEILSAVSLNQIIATQSNTYIIAKTADFPRDLPDVNVTRIFENNGIGAYAVTNKNCK
jgi:4-amino-4-deoxy-L-arabinose transferase-like glycosyltransferase